MSEIIIPIPEGCILSGIGIIDGTIVSFYEEDDKSELGESLNKENKEPCQD